MPVLPARPKALPLRSWRADHTSQFRPTPGEEARHRLSDALQRMAADLVAERRVVRELRVERARLQRQLAHAENCLRELRSV